ncbi:MAG: ATP-binding domain-containing protein, partial [Cyclobacteriaceae bacterium]
QSQSLHAATPETGNLRVIRYPHDRLVRPMVEDLGRNKFIGTTAILTRTNDEVLKADWHLRKEGISAKTVYGSAHVKLADLEEIKKFLAVLDSVDNQTIISEALWNEAKKAFHRDFEQSANYTICKELLLSFQTVNTKYKYRSDFEVFVQESNIEDFIQTDEKEIVVSTLHKAKGKEFDHVILLLGNFQPTDPEDRRLLYVGLSRAKHSLTIHYNNNFLQHLIVDDLQQVLEKKEYPFSDYLSFQLGYKDVNLGYFAFVQNRMEGLLAGSELLVNEEGLSNQQNQTVLKFSKSFKEKLTSYFGKKYVMDRCVIQNIVIWKTDDEKEVRVILPLISLVKCEDGVK